MPSAIDGERAGRAPGHPQRLVRSRSHSEPDAVGAHFTFAAFVQPTAPPGREQAIASHGDPFTGDGRDGRSSSPRRATWRLSMAGAAGPARVAAGVRLDRWTWVAVGLVRDGDRVAVWARPLRGMGDAAIGEASVPPAERRARAGHGAAPRGGRDRRSAPDRAPPDDPASRRPDRPPAAASVGPSRRRSSTDWPPRPTRWTGCGPSSSAPGTSPRHRDRPDHRRLGPRPTRRRP